MIVEPWKLFSKFRIVRGSCCLLISLALTVQAGRAIGEDKSKLSIHDQVWTIDIDPATLAAEGRFPNGLLSPISAAVPQLGEVRNVTANANTASWDLPLSGVHVEASVKNGRFSLEIVSGKAQTFTWPVLPASADMRAVILPHAEGFYIPVHERRWQDFLVRQSPINTMAEMSMPIWGVDYGDRTLTYIMTNPMDDFLKFEQKGDGLELRLTHSFQENYKVKRYGLIVVPGNTSPIEPALQFRKWLIETHQFVSLQEKLRELPELEKLFGAAHIYLWAGGVMDASDVRDWPALVASLRTPKTPAVKRVVSLFSSDAQDALRASRSETFPSQYTKKEILAGLNGVIGDQDLYQAALWPNGSLTADLQLISNKGRTASLAETAKLNSCLLSATFKTELGDCHSFGGGISPKMIQYLREAGLDRLLLLVPDLDTLTLLPQTVPAAKRAGYLFGAYDSYHSIHPPGTKNTWATAQFDKKLYDTGAIIKANGQRDQGFLGVGSHLSSIAAEPYLENRVTAWMKQFGFNAYFIDCDATGELFDNYSPTYPATKQLDMELRLKRMTWIINTFHVVLGSEIGASFAAPAIHYGQGMMTPSFGWGDPLLHDPKSLYFLGRYYPPDRPDVFFKPTRLPGKYKDIYFDPRYRLPLYEAAFHDSIITTHHWSTPSTKFTNVQEINELLELLYGVPPLYQLDLAEFEQRKQEIQTHNAFFSSNYRNLALSPLTDFTWLTQDHLLQKVEFGTQASVIANLRDAAFRYQEHTVPPHSILLIWKKSGKAVRYTSQYPADALP